MVVLLLAVVVVLLLAVLLLAVRATLASIREFDEVWRQYLEARQDILGNAGVKVAIPRLEETLARLARRAPRRSLYVLYDLAQALVVADRLDEAAQRAHQLVAISKANRVLQFESLGLLVLGGISFRLGRHDEALRAYGLVEQLSRDGGFDLGRAHAALRRGSVLFFLGCHDEALRAYEQAEPFYRNVGSDLGRAAAELGRGEVLSRLGRHEEALWAYEQAETLTGKVGDDLGRANVLQRRGEVLSLLERHAEALDAYKHAENLAERVGYELGRANALSGRGQVLFRLGRYDDALDAYKHAENLAERVGYELGRANALYGRGEVLFRIGIDRDAGDIFEQAESLMETALRLYRKHGATQNVVNVHSVHARALLEYKQYDLAVEVASMALAEVDSLRTRDTALLTRAAVGENYSDLVRTLIDAHLARGRVVDAVSAFEKRRGWTFEASSGDPIALLERARQGGGNWVLLSWQPPTLQGGLRVLLASPVFEPVLLTLSANRVDLVEPLKKLLQWQSEGTLRDQPADRWDELLKCLADVCLESSVLEARGFDDAMHTSLRDKTLRQLVGEHPETELRIVPVDVLQLIPWASLPWGKQRLIEAHPVVLGTTLERVLREPSPVLDGDALVVGNPDDTLHYAGEEARLITEWLTRHRRAVVHHGPDHPLTAHQYREQAPRYGLHHLSTHAAMNWVSLMDSVVVMSGDPNAARDSDAARRSMVRLPELLELSLPGSTVVLSACMSSLGDPSRMFDTVSLSAAYLAAGAGRVLGTLWTVDDKSTTLLMLRVYQGVLDDGLSWPRALQRAQVDMLHGRLREDTLPPGVSFSRKGDANEVGTAAAEAPRRGMAGKREAPFSSPYHWAAFALYGR